MKRCRKFLLFEVGNLQPRSEERKDEWNSNNEQALATIILGVKGTQLNYIRKCTKAADAWEKLAEVHKPKGPIQKVMLYKRLMSLKMEDNEEMTKYLNKFEEIVEKLSDIGIQLQEELIVIILLSSLPKFYESFIIAVETRDSLASLNVLKVKLLEESERRRGDDQETVDGVSQQAYVLKENKKFNKFSRANKAGRCFSCGRKGHYARDCRVNKPADLHVTASGRGKVILNDKVVLNNVLFCPELQGNFISLNKAVENGYAATFDSEEAKKEVMVSFI
ncbi:Retrovirus-related Pol polyprotein from transposon TNT 1-94 [Eumeta japonica]|uniref:Retrovirus-related Pol polyprotein from transposon TNT 1-94 n=1 Tax=Eumeta variegata TaxID=151549 RepID=A0A4C1ST79_EUMVA|nr:Retrovirus-related Pol polyprotein from transposon TNT 1-94 [Eumeta japonica]